MKALLIGMFMGAVMVGSLASQTKSASPGNQKAAQWSTTIVINDDGMGAITQYCKEQHHCAQAVDWHDATTAFAAGFALDRSCKGLTLIGNSSGQPSYPYWLISFHLGPDKTAAEWIKHQAEALAAGQPLYVHYDPLGQFNWSLSRSTGMGTDMEHSDASPRDAAHNICTIIKGEGGTVR